MTSSEYEKLYKEAFEEISSLTLKTVKRLKRIYIQSANRLSEKIIELSKTDKSGLTIESLQSIEDQLRREAAFITELLDKNIQYSVNQGASLITSTDLAYMKAAFERAGAELADDVLARIFVGVNNKVLTNMVTRVYKDGYTYSQRIWKVGENYQYRIKQILTEGIASNRDIIKIAKDLQVYVKSGRQALAKRYGGLEKGTPEWIKRMPKNLEYNSLRLVRSELYASLQDTAKITGRANPGCNNLYDWKKNTAEKWACKCEEYEKKSPYKYEDIPGYPHPNCLCSINPRLKNGNDFVKDLKSWVKGDSVPYLDAWYNEFYVPAA